MACRPSGVASCPVTMTLPFRPYLVSTVMIAPASPSLAACTPSTLPPLAVSSCSKVVPPIWLSHFSMACLATSLYSPESYFGFSTDSAPL